MTITRTFTHLGKTSEGYDIYHWAYAFAAEDVYLRATRIVMQFTGLSRVLGVLGLTGFQSGANLGSPVTMLSISGNTVTAMVLETGAPAGAGLAEKTNNEALGAAQTIHCTVFGV